MRNRPTHVGATALAALCLFGTAAGATEVKFPKDAPRIALAIPDDWTAAYTEDGLELESPEKDSLVVANVVDSNEQATEAWAKEAKKMLAAKGVRFDRKAKPNRVLTPSLQPDPTYSLNKPGSQDFGGFAGAPSLTPNFGPGDPRLAPRAKGPPKPFKVIQTFGAKLKDKPVDIELAIYTLPGDKFFMIEQQSGQTDARAAAIVKSFQPVP